MFFVLQSAEGVEYILPVSEDVIELHSDIRLQEAQGLPTFLLTSGAEKGVHLAVPGGDDVFKLGSHNASTIYNRLNF